MDQKKLEKIERLIDLRDLALQAYKDEIRYYGNAVERKAAAEARYAEAKRNLQIELEL